MASNGINNTQTVAGNPVSTPSKRKPAPRKTPAAGRPAPAPARKPATSGGPTEILFKELPNPYRQPEPPFIWIDFPQQNERLFVPEYVIRLGAGGADAVELSLDKGDWLPCRLTSGYWWFDWANIAPGKHTLVARMRTIDGRWFRTPPRTCEYRP
jgi:hypothetical protein